MAFVKARNLERRHLSAGQRAQIVVYFNERFGMGRPKSEDKESSSNDELKSREELAKEAGVSTATIDRAVAVEKEGASKAVMSGEKSASEVLKKPEDDIKMLREKVKAEMPLWKQRDKEDCQYESDCIGKASFSMLVSALRDSMHYLEDEDGKIPEGEATAKELKELLRLMKSDTFSFILRVRRELREASETDKDLVESESHTSPKGNRRNEARIGEVLKVNGV